jgi:hypothetical protein
MPSLKQSKIGLLNNNSLTIFCIWSVATLINIGKAYHIDDTFHLEAARWLLENPLKPMSGMINWSDNPLPMHAYNQPPLFFFVLAFWRWLVGTGELQMHIITSLFTFLSLHYFNKLLIFLNVEKRNTLLLLFGFCPAFIVNQNVMTDIPLLSCILGMIYHLLKAVDKQKNSDYFKAAFFLSAGLLIKYSILPLLIVFITTILLKKKYKKSVFALIPVIFLLLWSFWNHLEYGSVHMINRPKEDYDSLRWLSLGGTLGSMTFFTPILLYHYFPFRIVKYLLLGSFIFFISTVPVVYYGLWKEVSYNKFLNDFFIYTGFLNIIFFLIAVLLKIYKEGFSFFKTPDCTFAMIIGGLLLFMLFFAPFFATRHFLLIIPFLLIFFRDMLEKSKSMLSGIVIIFSVMIGLLLGISDWVYADFYRKAALKINRNETSVWSLGHWGWQWYSQRAGMKIYSKGSNDKVNENDIIVYPNAVAKQELNPNITLTKIDSVVHSPSLLSFFFCANGASMYHSSYRKPAWSLSRAKTDVVYICRVNKKKP